MIHIGRVIEDTTVDTTGPVFTLQREIASFSKSWFNRVSMKEPKSFFKLGSKLFFFHLHRDNFCQL